MIRPAHLPRRRTCLSNDPLAHAPGSLPVPRASSSPWPWPSRAQAVRAGDGPLGEFDDHGDVGSPKLAGSAAYNAVSQEYTLGRRRREHVGAARRVPFRVEADDRRLHPAGARRARRQGRRSAPQGSASMVRPSQDADSPYVDGVVHGDGLTSLQFRRTKGRRPTEQVESVVKGADVIQLERKGQTYTFSAAKFGELFATSATATSTLGDDVFVGLFALLAQPRRHERAIFRDVRLIRPAKTDFVPYRDYIGSVLEILDVPTGHRRWSISRPSRSKRPTGRRTAPRSSTTPAAAGGARPPPSLRPRYAPDRPSSTPARNRNNNDHVLSFDGTMLGISDQSTPAHGSDDLHRAGRRRHAEAHHAAAPSYLHGWSPDGRRWSTRAGGTASSTSTASRPTAAARKST